MSPFSLEEVLRLVGDLKFGLVEADKRCGELDLFMTLLGGLGGKTLAEPPMFWTFIGAGGAGSALDHVVTSDASV